MALVLAQSTLIDNAQGEIKTNLVVLEKLLQKDDQEYLNQKMVLGLL